MKLTRIVISLCAFAACCVAAPPDTPSAEELRSALDAAQQEWGASVHAEIVMYPLNPCPLNVQGTPRVADLETTKAMASIQFEDGENDLVSSAVTYVIQINSQCDWHNRQLDLERSVLHEVGHILIGGTWHSSDRGSVMYKAIVKEWPQHITQEDRQKAQANIDRMRESR